VFVRAVVAFLAMPGVVAFAVPVMIGLSARHRPPQYIAVAIGLVAGGTLLLLWCVREFYVVGRGTLAPWAPPQHLVTTGPYRFSRNPMYLGVTTILLGWSALWSSRTLLAYAVTVLCAFHLRVLLSEEPRAARHFGAEWQEYAARVPRWILKPRRLAQSIC
jgi:protein-S-isoprenylcysteine O-methyltransferase Ste14